MATITLSVTCTDTEQAVLLNDLLNINDWLQNDSDFTDSIPSNQADFVTLVTGRSDYKTRTQRDAASSIG